MRRYWTRLHHARSEETGGKRRELRPLEKRKRGIERDAHENRNFKETEERKKILPPCNNQEMIGRRQRKEGGPVTSADPRSPARDSEHEENGRWTSSLRFLDHDPNVAAEYRQPGQISRFTMLPQRVAQQSLRRRTFYPIVPIAARIRMILTCSDSQLPSSSHCLWLSSLPLPLSRPDSTCR